MQEYWRPHGEQAQNRLKEFKESWRIPYDEYIVPRRGDIVARKTSDRGQQKSGPAIASGLFKHFMIVSNIRYAPGDGTQIEECELIDKAPVEDGRQQTVSRSTVTWEDLKREFVFLNKCRYEDTADVAEMLLASNFDAGYEVSESNCEHFVTFCLTRDSAFSESEQSIWFRVFSWKVSTDDSDYEAPIPASHNQIRLTIQIHKKASSKNFPNWAKPAEMAPDEKVILSPLWVTRVRIPFPN